MASRTQLITLAAIVLSLGAMAVGTHRAHAEGPGLIATFFETPATDASAWHDGFHNRVRLLRARVPAPQTIFERALQRGHKLVVGAVLVGIELEVDPGWKTYWRTPGEAGGIAPHFDFAGSDNVAAARVLYPAPQRMRDQYGVSVGYKDRVLFPVVVEPTDSDRKVTVKAELLYGVCRDICHPAEAKVSLSFPLDQLSSDIIQAKMSAAFNKVPAPVSDPSDVVDAVSLGGVKVTTKGAKPAITVDLVKDAGSGVAWTEVDLFVEAQDRSFVPVMGRGGPEAYHVGPDAPNAAEGDAAAGSMIRFTADLTKAYDLPALARTSFKATLVAGDRAVVFPISQTVRPN